MVEPETSQVGRKGFRRPAAPLLPLFFGLIVVIATGLFAYHTESGVSSSRGWVLHTYDVRTELQNLEIQLAETRGNALAYATSGDERQLSEFRIHSENISRQIENLRKLTADNPRQQYRIGELESLSKKYIADLDQTIVSSVPRSAAASPQAAAIRGLDSQQSQQNAIVRSMADDEQMLLDTRLQVWRRFFL